MKLQPKPASLIAITCFPTSSAEPIKLSGWGLVKGFLLRRSFVCSCGRQSNHDACVFDPVIWGRQIKAQA